MGSGSFSFLTRCFLTTATAAEAEAGVALSSFGFLTLFVEEAVDVFSALVLTAAGAGLAVGTAVLTTVVARNTPRGK